MFIALATGGGVQVELSLTERWSLRSRVRFPSSHKCCSASAPALFRQNVCLFFLSSLSLNLQFPEQLAKQTLILPSIFYFSSSWVSDSKLQSLKFGSLFLNLHIPWKLSHLNSVKIRLQDDHTSTLQQRFHEKSRLPALGFEPPALLILVLLTRSFKIKDWP